MLFKEAQKKEDYSLNYSKSDQSNVSSPKGTEQESDQHDKVTGHSKSPIPRALTPKQQEALENFRRQSKTILDQLPLKSDLQKLDDGQAHSIPQELLQTGRELGKLKELVIKYPNFKELQDEAKTYYKSCADKDEVPTSIRSLCLFNRLQLAKNHNEKFDISSYPPEIKQLVLELAPLKRP